MSIEISQYRIGTYFIKDEICHSVPGQVKCTIENGSLA